MLGENTIPLPSTRVSIDSKHVGSLFMKHGPMVYSRARRLMGNHEDAEEATQEIFVRVITSGEAPPSPDEVVLWLSRITTNYCLNRLRDRRRRTELLSTKVLGAGEDETARSKADQLAQARALLARADERQAQAAVYVFIDGMSHQEAADVLGVSKRTVGNLVDRFTAWAREQTELPATRRSSAGGAA